MRRSLFMLITVAAFSMGSKAHAWSYISYICGDVTYEFIATPEPEDERPECYLTRNRATVRGCSLDRQANTLTLPVTSKRPQPVVIPCTSICERVGGMTENSCEPIGQ